MGQWMQVGQHLPVQDEYGGRPDKDSKGKDREREWVLYEKFAPLEFQVDDLMSAKERRFLETILQNMSRLKQSSTATALDWEVSYKTATKQFIKGVRLKESGDELETSAMEDFFDNFCDLEDVVPILQMLQEAVTVAKSKKKNFRSLFD